MKERLSVNNKLFIAICIAIFVVGCALMIGFFAPRPMRVDWSKVKPIENNVMLLAPNEGGNPTDSPALIKLNDDGSFDSTPWRVLQFTDMHFSGKMDGNERTLENFLAAMQKEKPDYVTFTGDVVTGIRGRARAVQFAEIMEKLGVYWSYCLGNHEGDQALALTRAELMRIWEKYPHALLDDDAKTTSAGEKVWGIGNYVINLLGEDYKVVQSMIFMDSGDKISDADAKKEGVKKGSYDHLKASQLTWYEEQVRKVTEDLTNGVKTMLFIHIPLPEQRNMRYVSAGTEAGEGWTKVPGSEIEKDGKEIGSSYIKGGWKAIAGTANYEEVCSSDYNSGTYALMIELRKGVNGLFNGHDHVNDSILYEEAAEGETPVYLSYGICSGYGTYSLYSKGLTDDPNDLMKGYSVIEIKADSTFDLFSVWYEKKYERIPRIIGSLPCGE